MRLATSAVVGALGFILLAVGTYSDSTSYLQEARELWDDVMNVPPTDPDNEVAPDQVIRLRQHIAQLEAELAAKQAARAKPDPIENVAAPASPTQKSAAPPGTVQPAVVKPEQQAVAETAPTPPPILVQPVPLKAEPVRPESRAETAKTQPQNSEQGPKPEVLQLTLPRVEPVVAEPPKVVMLNTDLPKPDVPKPPPPRQETVRTEPAAPEVTKLAAPRPDMARPAPLKLASARPVMPPPPPALPARQETDDTQSVLTRLRQATSGPVRAPDPQQPAEPKPRPLPSPSIPRLTAARSALAAGRVEDARRMLQEAQLQLVFRPVNLPGDDQPSAARGASDVAHALEALSANETSLSRRYIDGAIDDLSGTGTSQPVQDVQIRPTGYAPAYPPR